MIEIKFKDFIKLNRGFDLPNDKMIYGEYPVVASTNIKGFHRNFKVKSPCVVTGRSGSLGTVQYINKDCIPLNTTLYVKDFKRNNPKYVYYFLQTMNLEIFNSGAGVPTLNQNHLHNINLRIHDLQTQPKIADILSAYDDLIENNNRRIELLEKAAQNLYKEWFVRFRFPNYKQTKFENGLPQGWEITKIIDIVKRLPFGTLYKENDILPEGKVIVIDQSRKEYVGFHNNEPSHKASIENPIILFGDHTCKMKLMIDNFSLSENVVPFISNNNISIIFLYYLVNSLIETNEYKRHWTDFMSKKVLLPKKILTELFEKQIKNLMVLINNLEKQNRNLIKQRDLLLPRLMSGKLEVE